MRNGAVVLPSSEKSWASAGQLGAASIRIGRLPREEPGLSRRRSSWLSLYSLAAVLDLPVIALIDVLETRFRDVQDFPALIRLVQQEPFQRGYMVALWCRPSAGIQWFSLRSSPAPGYLVCRTNQAQIICKLAKFGREKAAGVNVSSQRSVHSSPGSKAS